MLALLCLPVGLIGHRPLNNVEDCRVVLKEGEFSQTQWRYAKIHTLDQVYMYGILYGSLTQNTHRFIDLGYSS